MLFVYRPQRGLRFRPRWCSSARTFRATRAQQRHQSTTAVARAAVHHRTQDPRWTPKVTVSPHACEPYLVLIINPPRLVEPMRAARAPAG